MMNKSKTSTNFKTAENFFLLLLVCASSSPRQMSYSVTNVTLRETRKHVETFLHSLKKDFLIFLTDLDFERFDRERERETEIFKILDFYNKDVKSQETYECCWSGGVSDADRRKVRLRSVVQERPRC